MQLRRRSVFNLPGVILFVLACAGAVGPVSGAAGILPANVHQAVAQQVKTNPDGLVRVIVTQTPAASGVEDAAVALGARITARWSMINSFAAEVPARSVSALAKNPGVRAVLSSSPTVSTATVDETRLKSAYPYAVRAEEAWRAGYTGSGVTIAIVDSGVHTADGTNSDFGGRISHSVSFHKNAAFTTDRFGHGTHVAAIAAGNGQTGDGAYTGIAPGANLINVKFSDDEGRASEEDLINALQWVYDHREAYNIRIVNISSTVSTQQSYLESATSAAVEQLWAAGLVVVVSAGNRGGEDCATCYAPAHDPFVISVGAVDDAGTRSLTDDFAKEWSSAGETLDGHMKPDITAPGAHVTAYMPTGSLRTKAPDNIVDHSYFRMGGTSMAAPVVSGSVALLLEARPDLTPNQVKWLLTKTARTYQGQPSGTPGALDIWEAINYSGSIGEANQNLKMSPLLDPMSGTINYSNTLWGNTLWGNTLWGNAFEL
ncbi:MAG: S8 family peptidase [Bacillota bacterium]